MIYKVLVNEGFKDKYSDKVYKVGETIDNLTEERVNEINAVKKDLISVISKKEKSNSKKEDTTKKEK